ncbi:MULTISPECIES: chemotaxis protein CheX [Aliivibrio]|uniref:Chemotaxis protein CheX n=1 Tax=Aliivibrio finisterrensis TaxID=511998 RepID=A0A4Q5KQQ2_9GAMM|nr:MULTISPECIES: chemotaxis protein CheX [Aliivibrio]MDD9180343.1 chemotaxis protein CheX [Aliivibrio sp. A6]MDD9199158.1 chemotaxis protein CheX [Aliivibrio sp. S2MY1]RYU49081.1 chemotaxis protein CheX [Aliivibrio finisterrensis]RYU49389.1 chemotaxis protein CheX [Aliivibrio finisterrensis]RYU55219.1 chemotaxis protein CheX [Aliivibrio finisterrensis]
MKTEFINPFLTSLMNVSSTMSTIQLTPKKPMLKKEIYAKGDISGFIGLTAPNLKGSLSVTFEKNLVLMTMEKMVGEVHQNINADVIDMVGEITSMVAGGAKRLLSEQGFDFDMATPIVVSGENHTIRHQSKDKVVLIPLNSDYGCVFLEISLE